MIFTHKAWFGICPIYARVVAGEPLVIHYRHFSLMPLFVASQAMYGLCIYINWLVYGDHSWNWGTRAQELSSPVEIDIDRN